MKDTTVITVTGHAGTNAELHITKTGREVTKFRLGANSSYLDAAGQWQDKDTQWFTVKAWGQQRARNVGESVRKGMPIVVRGSLALERWDGPDGERSDNVITARSVAVPIELGRVAYTRVVRETEASGEQSPASTGPSSGKPEPEASGPLAELPELPETASEVAPADPASWQSGEQVA